MGMHDGDEKIVKTDCTGTGATCTLEITPGRNSSETWKVSTAIDKSTCSGSVDFNVPGKPNPPPGALNAMFRVSRWFGQKVCVNCVNEASLMEYFLEFVNAT